MLSFRLEFALATIIKSKRGVTLNINRTKIGPKSALAATILALAAFLSGCSIISGSNEAAGSKPIEVPAEPVSITSVQSSLEAYRGKVVILDFWATWCPPCRAEIPSFVQLQNRYRSQGLEIIGVSIDPISGRGPGASAVAPFMKSYGINYAIWMVNDFSALAGYDVSQGIPTTYILNREGKAVKMHVGAKPMSVFENDIKGLL